MRARLGPFLALILVLSGCLTFQGAKPDPGSGLNTPEFPVVEIPIPVHLVTIGLAPDAVDPTRLLPLLPTERHPLVESVSGKTGTPTHQPVRYTFTYAFHAAPAGFAERFFRFALSQGEPGRPNAWLVDYDANGPRRLCADCSTPDAATARDVLYLDALASEAWLEAHRAEAGLAFEPGSVTLFLLDGENAGVLPTNTYHYWRFDDGHGHARVPHADAPPTVAPPYEALLPVEAPPFHTAKDPIALRAWGGRWDFVWLDLTAAPSAYDWQPRRTSPSLDAPPDAPKNLAEDWTDPPLWEVRNDPARLHENLGRDLSDFLTIRVARDPIYPVEAFRRFVNPIYVFVEPGALENPQTPAGVDLHRWVPHRDIVESLRLLMPWAQLEVPIKFVYLPQDDPAMFEALSRAKLYGDPTLVAEGVVKAYVRDAWDRYVPEARPGDFVIPQFYFYFNGPYTFWGANTAGGWADGDAWGKPWAIFDHFFDLCVRTDRVPCTKGNLGYNNITLLPLHEAGHELGLTHTKDTDVLDENGWPHTRTNWLWDSTYSLMSYRHVYMRFDHFDQRFLATAHAVDLLERLHAERSTPGVLEAEARVRDALATGRFVEAVEAAWSAIETYPAPMAAAAPTPQETLHRTTLYLPASRTLVGRPAFGPVGPVPNPLDAPGMLTSAGFTFDVPEGAQWIRVKYHDAAPAYEGTFKRSFLVLYGPDDSFRGILEESFEDEAFFTSHWRGAGTHEARVFQAAGGPGAYEVEVGVAG